MEFPVEEINFANVVVKEEYSAPETDNNDSEYWTGESPDIKPTVDPLKQENDWDEDFNREVKVNLVEDLLTPKIEPPDEVETSDYPCCHCPEKFENKKILLGHLKRIHNKCLYCPVLSPTRLKLQLHMVYNHRGLPMDISAFPFTCTICKQIFEDPETLREHNDEHNGIKLLEKAQKDLKVPKSPGMQMTRISRKSYQCEFCNRTFYDKKNFESHIQRIHIKKTLDYPCPNCGEISCNKTACLKYMLDYHRDLDVPSTTNLPPKRCKKSLKYKIHENIFSNTSKVSGGNSPELQVADFSCFTCSIPFNSKINLLGHLLRIHNKCLYCTLKFSNTHRLKSHMVFQHKGLPMDIAAFPFACTMCKELFDDPEMLKQHFQKHKPETQLTCEICNQRFRRKANMVIHMQKRHGISETYETESSNIPQNSFVDYACPYCGKVLQNRLTCYNHMTLHEKEPSSCFICKKTFKTEKILLGHMEKCHVFHYTCEVCPWSSTDTEEYLKHMNLSEHIVVPQDEKKSAPGSVSKV
uniref:C2H2-type domain-containing protein n=2 Tax=Lutzomyia longipalpis TaxID=7200 RepID=A0A1B0CKX8_LUTLO